MVNVRKGLIASFTVALALATPAHAGPERVADLAYGELLYAYLQGEAYTGLTLMAVAREQGGIQGHGRYPELLEGAMALNFAMPRKAGRLFSGLLEESVPADTRNQAWFFLGKQAFLEGDHAGALAGLQHIDGSAFSLANPDDHAEWLYMQGMLALRAEDIAAAREWRARLDQQNPYSVYLDYNLALAAGEAPAEALAPLRARLNQVRLSAPERRALEDWLRVTEASFQVDAGEFAAAVPVLQGVALDSPLADQALYGLALASLSLKDYPLALSALQELSGREGFTDWDIQAPYARAWVLEQIPDPALALEAYAFAAEHYNAVDQQLIERIERLEQGRLDDWLQVADQFSVSALATPQVTRDAYGRLEVLPRDFALSQLVAAEPFQMAVRQLADLNAMENELQRWQTQLDMLEESLRRRAAHGPQLAVLDQRISVSLQRLQTLEQEGVDTRQLQRQFLLLQQRRDRLAASDPAEVARLAPIKMRIETLRPQILAQRSQAEALVLGQIRSYFDTQQQIVRDYRLASQQARTRLLDEAFRRQQESSGG